MTIEEAKKELKYQTILFHNDGTVVFITTCVEDNKEDFWQNPENSIYTDEYKIYPQIQDFYNHPHKKIKILELGNWHFATLENLQNNLKAYCNFLAYKQDLILGLLDKARISF